MALGELLVGLAFTAGVALAAGIVAGNLSRQEEHKQREMRNSYDSYCSDRKERYKQTVSSYQRAYETNAEEYRRNYKEERRLMLERLKENNRPYIEEIRANLNEQRKLKTDNLKQLNEILEDWEKNKDKSQNTMLRMKAIKKSILTIEEACYKLRAYLCYLDRYENNMDFNFERSGSITEPFFMTLPDYFPYPGKIYRLKKSDLYKKTNTKPDGTSYTNYVYDINDEKNLRLYLSRDEEEMLEQTDKQEIAVAVCYNRNNDKKENQGDKEKLSNIVSIGNASIKDSIGGMQGLYAEVCELNSKMVTLNYNGRYLKLPRSMLNNYNQKLPQGSFLTVYVTDYDFALKRPPLVSEKPEDGLSLASFNNVAMEISKDENIQINRMLIKKHWEDLDDEWRIGPAGSELPVVFVKLQMGDKYGFLAKFRIPENSSDPGGQKILEYQRMLNPDEFMTFTDIFAAASVTIEMRSILAFDRFPELATEGGALYTYLCSEFSSQKKILTKSKMMLYFEKWLELTNRLIDVLRYQNRITVEVESWDVIGSITYLYPRSNSKVLKFIQKCEKNSYSHRPFFMLHDAAGDKEEYLICYVKTEEDSEQIILSVRNMPEQHILDMGCSMDLVMRGSVSAELTQAKAFSDFREGRVCNIALKEIILEDSGLTYHDTDSRIDCFYNKRIGENEKQFEAVHRAFAVEDFFMIQGPPGTGKTTVIKELIMQQLHFDSNSRILIVSQANVAVDNVLRGIKNLCQKEYGISENQIIRCGKEDRIADDIKDFSFEGRLDTYSRRLKTSSCQNPKLRGEWIEFIENPDNKEIVGECLLKGFQIIGATCVGFANRNIGLSGFEFDLVIIDEAGKALPGELLIPINHAKKLIIIGDHKQLPPVVNPEMYDTGAVRTKDVIDDEERQDFFNKSFFERLWEKCPESNKCMLDRQFRMPPAVSRLVNLFYDNKLKDGANCKDKYPMAFGNNLVMLDMANEKDYREGKEDDSGPFNLKEADAVVLMITRLREVYSDGIVVITPYKNQKRKLISRIKEKNLWGIRVDTIDAFQGDEENIVIYCMTRSHIKTIFFSDCARLNVAFSRAKNLLIIIGSTKYLRSYGKEHILSRVEELIHTYGRVVSSRQQHLLFHQNMI